VECHSWHKGEINALVAQSRRSVASTSIIAIQSGHLRFVVATVVAFLTYPFPESITFAKVINNS